MSVFKYLNRKTQLTKYKSTEAIDIIARDTLAPLLKKAGYKKAGRTWTKNMDEYTFIVSIYGSQWNGVETGAQFFISYNIYVPKIFSIISERELPKKPNSYDCVFGQLLPRVKDKDSWEIFDNTNMEALKSEIEAQLQKQCLNAFSKIKNLDNVKNQLMNGLFAEDHLQTLGLAALCAEMEDTTNAKHYFGIAVTDQIRTQKYRDQAKKVMHYYNLN